MLTNVDDKEEVVNEDNLGADCWLMIGLCWLVMGHDSTLRHSKIAKAIHRICGIYSLLWNMVLFHCQILRGSWESTFCRNSHPHTLPPVPPAKILVALQRCAAMPTRPAVRATPWLPWPVSSTVTGPSLQRSTSLKGLNARESGEAEETNGQNQQDVLARVGKKIKVKSKISPHISLFSQESSIRYVGSEENYLKPKDYIQLLGYIQWSSRTCRICWSWQKTSGF